ncbi:HAD family hydrolase [Celerinatantimonas yamalensis]|uniref:HAD family hydrolase n=1 Tax=Celerinatantimonas yamalensis TaxID=559956 RepID=A0ABW9G7F9_9GAMM
MNLSETLYISDLDGTLLNDSQLLSEGTISYLSEAVGRGLNFTFATARSIASSKFVLDSLNLKLPVILYNGAQIYCPVKKEYIHSAYLESESYLHYLEKFLESGLEPVVHCLDENDQLRVYFQSVSNDSTANWINSRLANGDSRFRVTKDFSEIDNFKVIELMVVASRSQLDDYQVELSNEQRISNVFSEDIYCKDHYWLELTHANANKGNAVEALKEYLQLKNIVSFGDNHNDIPMFNSSNHSLAVGNSKKAVQKYAKGVIESNNDDAVVSYLRENVTICCN